MPPSRRRRSSRSASRKRTSKRSPRGSKGSYRGRKMDNFLDNNKIGNYDADHKYSTMLKLKRDAFKNKSDHEEFFKELRSRNIRFYDIAGGKYAELRHIMNILEKPFEIPGGAGTIPPEGWPGSVKNNYMKAMGYCLELRKFLRPRSNKLGEVGKKLLESCDDFVTTKYKRTWVNPPPQDKTKVEKVIHLATFYNIEEEYIRSNIPKGKEVMDWLKKELPSIIYYTSYLSDKEYKKIEQKVQTIRDKLEEKNQLVHFTAKLKNFLDRETPPEVYTINSKQVKIYENLAQGIDKLTINHSQFFTDFVRVQSDYTHTNDTEPMYYLDVIVDLVDIGTGSDYPLNTYLWILDKSQMIIDKLQEYIGDTWREEYWPGISKTLEVFERFKSENEIKKGL